MIKKSQVLALFFVLATAAVTAFLLRNSSEVDPMSTQNEASARDAQPASVNTSSDQSDDSNANVPLASNNYVLDRESGDFEYEWQFSVGDKVKLEITPTYPRARVRDLIDETVVGVDAEADFEAFRALQFCRDAPLDPETYEARKLKLLTTRSPGGFVVVDDTRPAEEMLTKKFELCEGLVASDFNGILSRIQSAADGGLPVAKVEYSEFLVNNSDPLRVTQDQKDLFIGLIEEAKSEGVADAFYWSGFYGINGVSGQDKVSAIASLMVAEAIYREHGIRTSTADVVDREYRLLYPEERMEARSRALELVAAESCCSLSYEENMKNMEGKSE